MSRSRFEPHPTGRYGCAHALADDDGTIRPCIWTRGSHIGHDAWAAPDAGDTVHWAAWDRPESSPEFAYFPWAFQSVGACTRVRMIGGAK